MSLVKRDKDSRAVHRECVLSCKTLNKVGYPFHVQLRKEYKCTLNYIINFERCYVLGNEKCKGNLTVTDGVIFVGVEGFETYWYFICTDKQDQTES